MTAIGRFPKMQRFRGKQIGWLKQDIWGWMVKGRPAVAVKRHGKPRPPLTLPAQQSLPLCFRVADPWSRTATASLKSGASA
jgi:hypothetical protein